MILVLKKNYKMLKVSINDVIARIDENQLEEFQRYK